MVDIVIVGAGISGLSCGIELASRGVSFVILEASDGVGGRARTDEVEGFLLDRGFQVLLTAYPEAQRLLDYDGLRLSSFEPGAMVRLNGRFHAIGDPIRRPATLVETMTSPIGSMGDKIKIASLRRKVTGMELENIFLAPEVSTLRRLKEDGFSEQIISTFFRPFLSGIFLEAELETSSRMFEFVFRMFSLGEAALPARGMGAIAAQLAGRLPSDAVRLGQTVKFVKPGSVELDSGEEIKARAVVVATNRAKAARLSSKVRDHGSRSTTCFYFAADKPPVTERLLLLNGESDGPINNLCVPSVIAPTYAPPGKSLVSVSLIGTAADDGEIRVKKQLVEWFGKSVESWRLLKKYWVEDALPVQSPVAGGVSHQSSKLEDGVYICGDYCDTASINGAMLSGRRAAEAIAAEL